MASDDLEYLPGPNARSAREELAGAGAAASAEREAMAVELRREATELRAAAAATELELQKRLAASNAARVGPCLVHIDWRLSTTPLNIWESLTHCVCMGVIDSSCLYAGARALRAGHRGGGNLRVAGQRPRRAGRGGGGRAAPYFARRVIGRTLRERRFRVYTTAPGFRPRPRSSDTRCTLVLFVVLWGIL